MYVKLIINVMVFVFITNHRISCNLQDFCTIEYLDKKSTAFSISYSCVYSFIELFIHTPFDHEPCNAISDTATRRAEHVVIKIV